MITGCGGGQSEEGPDVLDREGNWRKIRSNWKEGLAREFVGFCIDADTIKIVGVDAVRKQRSSKEHNEVFVRLFGDDTNDYCKAFAWELRPKVPLAGSWPDDAEPDDIAIYEACTKEISAFKFSFQNEMVNDYLEYIRKEYPTTWVSKSSQENERASRKDWINSGGANKYLDRLQSIIDSH